MQPSAPLLYCAHEQIHNLAPVRKVKLLPVKTLMRSCMQPLNSELKINQYLTVYPSVL